MTLLPILIRDWRSDRGVHRVRRDRLMAGGAAALIVLVLSGLDRWVEGINLGRFFKTVPLTGFAAFPLLIIGLSKGAKLLSAERREGTLPLLLLTRLTGYDILLGNLLVALVTELNAFLAMIPAIVLPLIMAGFKWPEVWLTTLACFNLIFFGLGVGLFVTVFMEEQKAVTWAFLFVCPFVALATPLGMIIPKGAIGQILNSLQIINPAQPLAHITIVAGGLRQSAYWVPLLLSQFAAWTLLAVGGYLLAPACRWQASRNGNRKPQRSWMVWRRNRSHCCRASLLDRNPILWVSARNRWLTVQVWGWMLASFIFWGWLAWLSSLRGVGILLVLVIGLAGSWLAQFLVTIPNEAGRRLLEDRQSGALEMLLCTPLSVSRIVRGQWLGLWCRYAAPFGVTMIVSLTLMLLGYHTYGFGGMLDPEDRPLWLWTWLAALALWPVALITLAWVGMRRALTARNAGEATAQAAMQVVALPCLILLPIPTILHSFFRWDRWDLEWESRLILFVIGFLIFQAAFSYQARRRVLGGLRQAAAERYLLGAQAPRRGLWATLAKGFGQRLTPMSHLLRPGPRQRS